MIRRSCSLAYNCTTLADALCRWFRSTGSLALAQQNSFLKTGLQINEPVVDRVFKYIFAISARVLSKISNRHKHVLQRQLNKAERYFIGWQMTKLFSDMAESCLWFAQA